MATWWWLGVPLSAVGIVGGLPVGPGVVVADSVTGEIIRGLNRRLLYMAVPIAVLVELILVYAVVRFRNAEAPSSTRDNRQLEITWTVATALILLFVGTASVTALTSPYVGGGHSHAGDDLQPGQAPSEAVEVVVVGQQWRWQFEYPAANRTTETLVLPRDRDVYLYVTSRDVIHSLSVPELGLKQDALPGQTTRLRTRLTATGTYRLYCAEFCGVDHADMETTVRVVDADAFDRWLSENASTASTATAGDGA